MTKLGYYEKHLSTSIKILNQLQRKLKSNSIIRLLVFLLIFISLFSLISVKVSLAITLSSIFLIVFLLFVKKHLALQKKLVYQLEKVKLYQNEILAIEGKWKSFYTGEDYAKHQHTYAYDLDILGVGSLFQFLNRTVTKEGEKLLIKKLMTEDLDENNIINCQSAIEELSKKPEMLEHFRTIGMTTQDSPDDKKAFEDWLNHSSYVDGNKFISLIRYLLPALFFISIVFAAFNPSYTQLAVLFFLTNLIIIGKNFKKTNLEHHLISKRLDTLKKYSDLLHIIESESFESKLLGTMKERMSSSGLSASSSIAQLAKSVSALDNRLNMLVGVVLEGTLLWDFHYLIQITAWKKKHSNELKIWIQEIAHFDSLVTMATFAFNHPKFKYPSISKNTPFNGKDLGHPLIPESKRVTNDFSIDATGDFIIITGANMAGKSTFLRTVGLNMVLAMLGLPVCAGELIFKPRRLFTSMRTNDSLSENESYFYAELKRLKEMFDLLMSGEDIFIILDEILKGTNSIDKQKGSRAALGKIIKHGGTGIIATHDLSLTEIEAEFPDKVRNTCFEIEIDNTKIHFDYKLYKGVTQKMNASLLMKQMGIID